MGEYADLMINGDCCEGCGVTLPGEAPGHPRYCRHCLAPRGKDINAPALKTTCHLCNKKVKMSGLKDHVRAVHSRIEHEHFTIVLK